MEESILLTIKKMIGLEEDYIPFDEELKVYINEAISTLNHIGNDESVVVTGTDQKWEDFDLDDETLGFVKQYIFLKVKLLFDPPASSGSLDSFNRIISELEFRINNNLDDAFIESSSESNDE